MMSLEVFVNKIKPACENFIRMPTKENLHILEKGINNLESFQLNSLQTYVLLPLVIKLDEIQGPNSLETKQLAIGCIKSLLLKVRLKDLNALKTIIIAILKEIYNFENGQMRANLSEELKLVVIECISTGLERSTQDILEKFYVPENDKVIASVCLVCTEIISTERYRILRIAGIKCLMAVFNVGDFSDFNDIVLRKQVANIVFLYLPKVVFVFVQIINGENTLGESLISISIRALGRILCLIFQDYDKAEITETIAYIDNDFLDLLKNPSASCEYTKVSDKEILGLYNNSEDISKKFQEIKIHGRNSQWLYASSRKLTKILMQTTKLCGNASLKIRTEYALFALDLLKRCHKYLKDNFRILLEVIISLSQDTESEDIRQLCNDYICDKADKFSTFTQDEEQLIRNEFINLFHLHIIRFPRIMHLSDKEEKISELLFFKGYFNLISDKDLNILLESSVNLGKLCECLISAFELQLHSDLLLEEYTLRHISEDYPMENQKNSSHTYYWRKFKNVDQYASIILTDICRSLGRRNIVKYVCDYYIDLLSKSENISSEIFLILSHILSDNIENEDQMRINIIYDILDEILNEKRWHLSLHPDPITRLDKTSRWYTDSTPGLYESAIEIRIKDIDCNEIDRGDLSQDHVSIHDAQIGVLHTCILLESVGRLSKSLKQYFRPFVFKSLHKILLKTGSKNYAVHCSGYFALQSVREALEYSNVSDLINDYSDYLCYHVNVAIKTIKQDQVDAIEILMVIMEYDIKLYWPHLENVLSTLLTNCCTEISDATKSSFFRFFQVFLNNFAKHYQVTINSFNNDKISKASNVPLKEILFNWISKLNGSSEELNSKNLEENTVNEEKEYDSNENSSNEGNLQKKEIPGCVKIVIEIIKNAIKLISHTNDILKINCIDCLIIGLPLLKGYDDEFLPLVHDIWNPFIENFKLNNIIIFDRSFHLLEVMAHLSNEFVLHRTIRDIFPTLIKFLEDTSTKNSEQNDTIPTQKFKLQIKILQKLPNLLRCIQIEEEELTKLFVAVKSCLHCERAKLLQEHASNFFTAIFPYNAPFIYVQLSFLVNTDNYKANAKRILNKISNLF